MRSTVAFLLVCAAALVGCGGGASVDAGGDAGTDARADVAQDVTTAPDAVADAGLDAAEDAARADAQPDAPRPDAPADVPADRPGDAPADVPADVPGGGCASNADCLASEYCAAPSCSGRGTCAARPSGCTREIDPHCGCDGRTYSNACLAQMAGVRVASRGECMGGPPDAGAPSCRANGDCGRGQYCELPIGTCGGTGACVMRPVGCPDVDDPHCGCDGRTYGNACEAATNGVSIRMRGACAPRPDAGPGGCTSNADCSDAQYCQLPAGACTGVGMCADRPEICLGVIMPVCGCDGRTYSNACVAGSRGVNVRADGECP